MKKSVYFAAALIALASCTSDEFTGDKALGEANGKTAISFGFETAGVTRAENTGATAAASLGNQFIVYGEKSETADGAAPAAGKLVFQNYQVNYVASTANTTTSNTKDWEYVGAQHTAAYQSHITTSTTDVQTIKYWDYSATNYVFTAFSAKQADITNGDVTVTKITAKTDGNKIYDKGYTVVLTADADPTKLYFSDRKEIAQGTGTDRTTPNAYGGNVTLKFRNGISQIRVGMYETIPGYSVTIDKFYYVDNATPSFGTMATAGTDKFYANVPNLTMDKGATLTVTYYNSGDRINQPKIAVSGTANNYLALGGADASTTGLKATAVLSETIATPTYNETTGAFTPVYPQESNDKSLKLKLDYTLTAPVTGEIIKVTGATAEIPAEFLQWKPNFKYTYIFKVSDNTNGSTGGSVTGLYPITFDAVEVVAEDGTAEYITTVSDPSITTFGTVTAAGKTTYVKDGSEYAAGNDVYATIVDGGTVIDPTSKYNVYTVTTSNATNFPITEASVAESLAEISAKTHEVTCTAYAGTKSLETQLPGEDGKTITLSAGKAIKLPALAAGTYAVEYAKTARTYKGEAVTYDTKAQYDAAFAKVNLYTDAACSTAAVAASWSDSNKTFYKQVVDDKGAYAYKVIKVVAP